MPSLVFQHEANHLFSVTFDSYLQRVSQHPILCTDDNFIVFLTYDGQVREIVFWVIRYCLRSSGAGESWLAAFPISSPGLLLPMQFNPKKPKAWLGNILPKYRLVRPGLIGKTLGLSRGPCLEGYNLWTTFLLNFPHPQREPDARFEQLQKQVQLYAKT